MGAGQPSEEELRAAYEAELSRITSADMVLQATVSLLNLGARRLGLVGGPDAADTAQQASPERDLEQVRDAIDAVRGLMPVIERRAPQEARPLRDALSQLQMAYAREVAGGAPATQCQRPSRPRAASAGRSRCPAGAPTSARASASGARQPRRLGCRSSAPGPAESSGRLWVPGTLNASRRAAR